MRQYIHKFKNKRLKRPLVVFALALLATTMTGLSGPLETSSSYDRVEAPESALAQGDAAAQLLSVEASDEPTIEKDVAETEEVDSATGFDLPRIFGPSPAEASAYGCSFYSFLRNIKDVPIYKGHYCVYLRGSGTNVSYVHGGFTNNLGSIPGFEITAEFYDTRWNHYRTDHGGWNWGNRWSGDDRIHLNRNVREGFMCSTLRTRNWARVTSVCHQIHK